MKFRITIELDGDDLRTPEDALEAWEEGAGFPVQVRQEPFDAPSPMWDVDNDGATLRRLR